MSRTTGTEKCCRLNPCLSTTKASEVSSEWEFLAFSYRFLGIFSYEDAQDSKSIIFRICKLPRRIYFLADTFDKAKSLSAYYYDQSESHTKVTSEFPPRRKQPDEEFEETDEELVEYEERCWIEKMSQLRKDHHGDSANSYSEVHKFMMHMLKF